MYDMIRNIKNILGVFLCTSCGLLSCVSENIETFSPADYVNPFIGASCNPDASGSSHGLGKTIPGAFVPYGYSEENKTIEGFALTQMSGVGWFGEMGNFLVMPTTGELKTIPGREDGSLKGWRSYFDKETEIAKAGYYSVKLIDYDILAETSASPHCGIMRFTFPENNRSRIQVDLARRIAGASERQYLRVVDENTIEGWIRCTPNEGGWGNA